MAADDDGRMSEQRHPNRLLVVANRTCPCPDVLDTIRRHAGDNGDVLIVAPALNSRLRHWVSDLDEAVAAAQERLDRAVESLGGGETTVRGMVGDADPLVAIEDALVTFAATEIIISTWPAGQSNWLERDLIRKARARFGLPILHLVSSYGTAGPVAA